MEYVTEMKRRDLNNLSEFLVMAATLLEIKAKMLLPQEPDDEEEAEDPRAELVQQLLEYKMYKCMAYELKDRQMDAERIMYRQPAIPDEILAYKDPVDVDELVADVTLARLNEIFQSIMKKQVDKIDPVRSRFGRIEKEEVSLEDKMAYLEDYAANNRHFSFRALLEAQASKTEIVVTFLAILELMKMGKIFISQEHIFDDIQIDSKIAA
jgi:segregation and condensation protein A